MESEGRGEGLGEVGEGSSRREGKGVKGRTHGLLRRIARPSQEHGLPKRRAHGLLKGRAHGLLKGRAHGLLRSKAA